MTSPEQPNSRGFWSLAIPLIASTFFPRMAKTQQMLKNLQPDKAYVGNSHPHSFGSTKSFGFFWIQGFSGRELWRTDGSTQGTIPLHQPKYPVPISRKGEGLGWNNLYFFSGYDPKLGWELFKTDGSIKGTVLLKDLFPGSGSSSLPEQFTASGPFLYFVGQTAAGRTLFRTDGTAGGTLALFSTKGSIQGLSPFGKKLLFRVSTSSKGPEGIAISDGTPKGTSIFINPPSYKSGREDGHFEVLGKRFFFSAENASPKTGRELFVSDGTPQGTRMLKDIWPGPQSSSPKDFEVMGSRVYFSADHPLYGRELWSSDGTAQGTVLVKDIEPGKVQGFPLSSDPHEIIARGNRILFAAGTTTNGVEPWISDGSAKGTHMLKDMVPGIGSSVPKHFIVAGNQVFFSLQPGSNVELYRTDLSIAGTRRLLALGKAPVGFPAPHFAPFGGRLLFSNYTSKTGNEPWISDGTSAGTHLLADLVKLEYQPDSSNPQNFLSIGDQVYFQAVLGSKNQIWQTDGSSKGTKLATASFFPSRIQASPDRILRFDWIQNSLHLLAFDKGTGRSEDLQSFFQVELFQPIGKRWILYERTRSRDLRIWFTDGTKKGTQQLTGIPSFTHLNLSLPIPFGQKAVIWGPFHPQTGSRNIPLWITDGTPSGTKLIRYFSFPNPLFHLRIDAHVAIGKNLFFTMRPNQSQSVLLKTDGSPKGTMVLGVFSRTGITSLTPLNGKILFSAHDPQNGEELWISDGTPKGTKLLKDLQPGSAGSNPYGFARFGNRVLFMARLGGIGRELFVTDGTAQGTVLLKDIHPGPKGSFKGIFGFLPIGSRRLAFLADDGQGIRFWGTDGTKKGTLPLSDRLPPAIATIYEPLSFRLGRVFFRWADPQHGFEPWVWFPGASARAHGLSCGTSPLLRATDPILGGSMSLSGTLDPKQPSGVLLLGSTAPTPLRMGKGCWLYVDPFRLIIPIPTLARQGTWSTSFGVPNQPSFAGLLFHAQVLHPLSAGGFDLSNPVELAAGK